MDKSGRSGNMILMLFGAVAVMGVVGTGYMATMKGPGRVLSESSRENTIENNMIAATKLVVSGDATKQDCDGDGAIEPMPFRTGTGPTGGGLVPLDAGAVKNDPWGKALGYCVWDHGKKSKSDNVATCGGSAANRLQGGNVTTENVLAIVSAGKDGIFQTTCNAWVDANTDKIADTPLIVTTAGSDDIVKKDTIESLLASGTLAQLPDLPDAACVAGAEGTLRFTNGVLQVCAQNTPGGGGVPVWEEIGASPSAITSFTATNNATPSTVYTSNTITLSGFFGTREVSVDNGGTLMINGVASGSTAEVAAGATIAIRGTSAAFASPATSLATNPKTFVFTAGSITRNWVLTTRGRTAPVLSVTPSSVTTMDVVGTSGTAYGTSVQFTITNTGEATTAAINAIAFAPATNFETTGTNLCTGNTLAGSGTCTFYVRPKATTPGALSTTMTVSATGATSDTSALSGTATGWCTVGEDWVAYPVTTGNWNTLAYGAGKFLASAGAALIQSTNGTSWTTVTPPANFSPMELTYANSRFVSVGAGYSHTSTNGTAWTQGSTTMLMLNSVTYGASKYVGVGMNRVRTSTDGLTWVTQSASACHGNRVAFGAGRFVVSGNTNMIVSTDGITWTNQPLAGGNWLAIIYAGGRFVSMAGNGTVATSTDGLSWTTGTSPLDPSGGGWWGTLPVSLAYGAGKYVAVSSDGQILHSTDGLNWTLQTGNPVGEWGEIVYANSKFVVVGQDQVLVSQCPP